MSVYDSLVKLINNANAKYEAGTMTAESYEQFKASTIKKMDMFVVMDRISTEQYEELNGMFIVVEA